jgi:DNA-binding NarL/FixJ family response regulator
MNILVTPIRILAVDDHAILREGLRALIDIEPDMSLVAQASNGQEALAQFRTHRPEVTLMDIQMPILDGIEAITAIRSEFPNARIIVLTTFAGDVLAQRAMKAGASAYVLKGLMRKDLPETIRAVHRGMKYIQSEVAAQIADHIGEASLSPREIEVILLVAAGNSNKRIGAKLSINEDTVKGHMTNIMLKLGASDRTHAVTLAVRRGIIQL